MKDNESLINIEMKISFQEDLMHTLNQVITAQQLQIGNLEHRVAMLENQLLQLASQLCEQQHETPPPHY